MKKTLEIINELKENGLIRDYAIGGAIGTLRWTETFFTRDLDIFITFRPKERKRVIDLSPIYNYLKNKGYRWQGQWVVIEGIPVDFIPADELGEEAIKDAQQVEIQGVKTKVFKPEYLIASFLIAGRDKDTRKIQMLFEQTKVDKNKLINILDKHDLKEKAKNFKKFLI